MTANASPIVRRTDIGQRLAAVPNLVRALLDPVGSHDRALREIDDVDLLRLVAVRPLDEDLPDVAARARRRADAIPEWATLRRWATTLDAALEEPPDEERTRVLLALLLDAFPRRVPSPETFLDAGTFLLSEERIGPGLVSTACRRLWAQRRSPPSFADVLIEARAARAAVMNARGLVQRAFAARQRAEAILKRLDVEGGADREPGR